VEVPADEQSLLDALDRLGQRAGADVRLAVVAAGVVAVAARAMADDDVRVGGVSGRISSFTDGFSGPAAPTVTCFKTPAATSRAIPSLTV
jgi:hypothetical protein